nr:hypothetical protein BSM_14320 [uncultured archaeon]
MTSPLLAMDACTSVIFIYSFHPYKPFRFFHFAPKLFRLLLKSATFWTLGAKPSGAKNILYIQQEHTLK